MEFLVVYSYESDNYKVGFILTNQGDGWVISELSNELLKEETPGQAVELSDKEYENLKNNS